MLMPRWERRGIRDTWAARAEWGGANAALPNFLLVVVLRLFYFFAISIAVPCEILATRRYHYMIKWQRRQRDKYRSKSLADRIIKASSASPIRLSERYPPSSITETTDLFFGRFPAEIRRLILIHAFGERTMRMEFNFERLPLPGDRISRRQRQRQRERERQTTLASDNPREEWVWRGTVYPPSPREDGPPLSLGRRRTDVDECYVDERRTLLSRQQFGKRRVGSMGWLLACRQAYIEGTEVLYGTNTLQVWSEVLLRGMHDLIPPTVISSIKSLELVWHPQDLRIEQILEGLDPENRQAHTPPLFPSLNHLHLHLSGLKYLTVGIPDEDGRYFLTLEELATDGVHSLDTVLARIAPPTAEVTVTCRYWDWFKLVGQKLIQSQGVENMRLEESEYRGPRIWRQIPPAKDETGVASSPAYIDLEQGGQKKMQGYWIHLVSGIIKSDYDEPQQPLDARTLF